jgi:hypothetical protein
MATLVGPRGHGSLTDATGWELKPEGLCRDDVCIPVADHDADPIEMWRHLGWPVATSDRGDAYLGEPVAVRPAARAGTIAPDFTLRDLAGTEHSLRDHRGKKVFLASWAPW